MTSVFVVHIIMNAWIAYTSTVIELSLEPHPWDALNVFVLSAAHFAINSFVGTDVPPFLAAVGVYSLTAAATVYGAMLRSRRDPDFSFPSARFRPVIGLNIAAGAIFLLFAWFSSSGVVSRQVEFVFVVVSIPYATLWLLLFWRGWRGDRDAEIDLAVGRSNP